MLAHLYSIELIYRLLYINISFIFCGFISFFNIQTLFLLETYPFLKLSKKKFLVTQTTDLIDTVWIVSLSTSFFFVFPLFFYQLIQFSKNSWYNYQIFFIWYLFVVSLFVYWASLAICYYMLLPTLLEFLSYWETKQTVSILDIEIEFRILEYIKWVLTFRYIFSFINFFIWIATVLILFSISLKFIYNLIKLYRKLLIFLTILFLFLLAPPDISLQFIIIFVIFTFYELIFLFICYKVCNTIYKKAAF